MAMNIAVKDVGHTSRWALSLSWAGQTNGKSSWGESSVNGCRSLLGHFMVVALIANEADGQSGS